MLGRMQKPTPPTTPRLTDFGTAAMFYRPARLEINPQNALHDSDHQADQSRRIGMPCKLAEKGIISAPV